MTRGRPRPGVGAMPRDAELVGRVGTGGPWLDRGASWVLTRVGPYDLDLDAVRRLVAAGPNADPQQ